jgi:hypothetical protein
MWRIVYTWWAILDGITHAAHSIAPGQVLIAMCITAALCSFIMPVAMAMIERLPWFRKQREAEQNTKLRAEVQKWQAIYGVKVARLEEIEPELTELRRLNLERIQHDRYHDSRVKAAMAGKAQ